ncbi:CD81 antigen-like [Notothenia coriiceps]|uniref:CD81 antigen-like n=1 Tax=Notothenia coriiceps TaxID=8208 RepID=A0A6I9NYK6_9TELE|nr:PREDICTED: CD81 antigen-like [Notothenia coriiceps]
MMVVGFLGCYGAIQESQCLLGTFFACLIILFACEVAAGIWGFMNKDTVATEMISFYDSAYDKAISFPALPGTEKDNKEKDAVTAVLRVFHETVRTKRNDSKITHSF